MVIERATGRETRNGSEDLSGGCGSVGEVGEGKDRDFCGEEIGRRMVCTNEEDYLVFAELKKKYTEGS